MPVISPRRSSTGTSGSLFVPHTTSGTYSSSLANKVTGSSVLVSPSVTGYNSSYRSNSILKSSTPTTYNSYYTSSYLPRTSGYSTTGRTSYKNTSSTLTGGSSALSSSYRPSSYLSGVNNDTTSSSRFGTLDYKTATDSPEFNNINRNTNSPCNKNKSRNSTRPSSASYSSSSLALLVATSALDIYEKYSPAHYIPKCELSRSSSLSEAPVAPPASITASSATIASPIINDAKINSNSNLISKIDNYSRRYSRLINGTINENGEVPDISDFTDHSIVTQSNSNDNVMKTLNGSNVTNKLLLHVNSDQPGDSKSLKDLKISSITPTTNTANTSLASVASSTTTSNSASSSGSQDTKDSPQLVVKIKNTSTTRTGLPPISPTLSRHWDRDTGRSTTVSSRHHPDDYSSSSKLTSSTTEDKSKQEGLCGLRNIGNTCFMNSVIQCLSHTSELTKFLRTQNGFRSSSSKDQQILNEFVKLIREMWSAGVSSVTPSDLKRAFSSKHRMYSDYNQQDAQEFLRFFLDSLHSALNVGVKGDVLKIDETLSDNRKADITWDWYSRSENSVIRDLFVGQLKSTLRCTVCGNTSVTFDPFWDLSVSLPSSSRCKLEVCLDLFIREEVLDGDEMPTCSKCKTRRKCTKSFTIQRFPKYLVIHLKRFSEARWSKMSNIVEFPTGERELNMGPYASNSSTNAYYSLYAISNHMGSTTGGHYVALCKHPISRMWHEFNDNSVSGELPESHLVSSSAYILFYERAK